MDTQDFTKLIICGKLN